MLHKKHLLELYVYNKVYMIWLFQYHTPYQPLTSIIPLSRAVGIILVSRVDTDAILKKPYDVLYLQQAPL